MKTVTVSDSKLTDREIREYIRYAKQWIQENYFENTPSADKAILCLAALVVDWILIFC